MRLQVVFALAGLAMASEALGVETSPRPAVRPSVEDARPSTEATTDALVLASKSPVPRPGDLMDAHKMRLALGAARAGDWHGAGSLATAKGSVAADVIEWQRLRSGEGSFDDYRRFLLRNADWPGLALLHKKGEDAIRTGSPAAQVIAYFEGRPPQTGSGALRLAAAHAAQGAAGKAQAEVERAWRELEMSAGEEQAFLAEHGAALKPHHAARLDAALWRGDRKGAARMLGLVDAGQKALAEARIALQREAGNPDALIAKIPAALRSDPGLAYDRMIWRVEKRRRDLAADLILATSDSAERLGRPLAWANWRRILARQQMREGNGKRAYALASTHRIAFTTKDYAYADLEWLSGYLALTYLKDPAKALTHFRQFEKAVYTPISLGRAGYWEGRALEAMGEAEAAMSAYRAGAKHQTSFYGQLAAEKAGVVMDAALTGRAEANSWRLAPFTRSSVFQAAKLFHEAGQSWETGRFLRHLAETLPADQLVQLADFTLTLGDPYLAVRVSKQVARAGVVAPRAYYPVTSLGAGALPVSDALALSIARRESEFHIAAVSGAGARGVMQLMPATAREMAGKLGLPYSKARLTTDPGYNAKLGSAYLRQLIEEFGENYVLVAAGYNAGPHRARRWIEANGDPRSPRVDVVDWIEHIPFRETRNYVMRVMESLAVYRARLSGETAPLRLSAELKAK
ncbi:MAG: lytic transglycosylase domain-containing protein [Rhodobacter sp.]|nr:lytic transglycosylase domain-containing protein [Rhodobacter sp.]